MWAFLGYWCLACAIFMAGYFCCAALTRNKEIEAYEAGHKNGMSDAMGHARELGNCEAEKRIIERVLNDA